MAEFSEKNDQYWMKHALALAEAAIGTTAPNPAVGCVIVKENAVLAVGATGQGGRPHAEQVALSLAGDSAKDATVYVTLEPCCHTGKTSPCTDALIKAGVRRVVVACCDPNPKVDGGGIAALQHKGIVVDVGVCEAEARWLNRGFFSVIQRSRPWVSLKLATSLDGKIALASGQSKWITGEEARYYGHQLRASHDAIMVGINTVLADDPMLNCRLEGLESQSPVRVVMDSHGRLPRMSQLVQSAEVIPCWHMVLEGSATPHPHVKTIICHQQVSGGKIAPLDALSHLADEGITSVLLEGGAALAASMIQAGLVDEIYWMQAPIIIGGDGLDAVGELGLNALSEATRLICHERIEFSNGDRLVRYITEL